MNSTPERPVGYQHLVETCSLMLPPLLRPGLVASVRTVQSASREVGFKNTLYPHRMWPGKGIADHLRFALQHEGVLPSVLNALAVSVDVPELIVDHARRHGTLPLHRRLAFMHTFLTGETVSLPVSNDHRYVDIASGRLQFVLSRGERDRMFRVRNNLLGDAGFCPQVFKSSELLEAMQEDDVAGIDPWKDCPPDIQERVKDYFRQLETQSSWKIESETPSAQRTREFMELLRRAAQRDYVSKSGLAELQSSITGQEAGADHPWRSAQVWVGYRDPQLRGA